MAAEDGGQIARCGEDFFNQKRSALGRNAKRRSGDADGGDDLSSMVANGRTDAYAELHINAWDVAAGIVIASEAGASITDFFAGEGISKGNPILCSTPALAPRLREIVGIS